MRLLRRTPALAALVAVLTVVVLRAHGTGRLNAEAVQTAGTATTTAAPASGRPVATTPEAFFGHAIGADYVLPNYTRFSAFLAQLDRESDRMSVRSIGRTAEGRDQLMAIITAPENFRRLDRYRDISRRLSLAEGLSDDEARALAREGKAVVWIDGGLHANEVLGAQQLAETIHQLVSRTDEETVRFLRDTIVLAAHANPDGMELVSDWYMRHPTPSARSTAFVPRLYQKYVGHDINRDFYMMNQPETENINRVLYREWFPQIVYNHHQTGPAGTVMFSPPFRDPFNYAYDPLVISTLDQVGAAMHARFALEGKPGVTTRSGSTYSTWWNGGLRTMPYFHNQVGLLTETIGNPTPETISFIPERQLPRNDLPYPIEPQVWHFRQSVDYSVTANRAVLDFASRYRESLLFNIYAMGRNSVRRGSTDTWTITPRRITALSAEVARESGASGRATPAGGGRVQAVPTRYFSQLRRPEARDPRGYVLPAGAGDFATTTKFVNILIKSGVRVHRATAPFRVGTASYPAGSYVVKTAQAFRPHVLDMFEPQDHPNDFQYPGGPPVPPYDSTGWTLAFQMGVVFDRVLDAFDGPFEVLPDVVTPPPGRVADAEGATGFVFGHRHNDATTIVNRLLKAGDEVFFVEDRQWQSADGTGVIYVTARPSTAALLRTAATELGIDVTGVRARPPGALRRLAKPRIGLWDQYGGSMPSGHVRWLLERFGFDFEVVYPQMLDAGNLRSRFDVLLFPDGGIPESLTGGGRQPAPDEIPAEFRPRLGRVSAATIAQLRRFAEAGGTVVAFGGSAVLGFHLGLPVDDHLVEAQADGSAAPLARTKYYIPGSLLRVAVDNTQPLAYGLPTQVDVVFDNSPVLTVRPEAARAGVTPVAWFADRTPLRSGWAWGQHYLQGGVAAVDASVGTGHVLLLGPEITFRAQPHGTFKLLFNGIYASAATRVQ